MSFEPFEDSFDRGEPIHLYLFEYGPSTAHRVAVTDAESAITFNGIVFDARPVQRDSINSSGTLDKTSININMDRESPVAELFRIYPPSQPVRLTIFQGHADDPDRQFLVLWTGRVLNVKWINSEAQLTCEPIATSLRRPGLRRNYQIACPHVLYGPICRANKAAATTTVTLAEAVNGARVVVVNYNVGSDNNIRILRSGTFEWVSPDGLSESRAMLSIQGNGATTRIVLSGIVKGLPAGYAVNLVKGCGHDLADCGSVHNNIPNYGGMPWIPTKNPMGKYSPYY